MVINETLVNAAVNLGASQIVAPVQDQIVKAVFNLLPKLFVLVGSVFGIKYLPTIPIKAISGIIAMIFSISTVLSIIELFNLMFLIVSTSI
jgi:hypothetical protein